MKKRQIIIKYSCSDFKKHSHKYKFIAIMCGKLQYLTHLMQYLLEIIRNKTKHLMF